MGSCSLGSGSALGETGRSKVSCQGSHGVSTDAGTSPAGCCPRGRAGRAACCPPVLLCGRCCRACIWLGRGAGDVVALIRISPWARGPGAAKPAGSTEPCRGASPGWPSRIWCPCAPAQPPPGTPAPPHLPGPQTRLGPRPWARPPQVPSPGLVHPPTLALLFPQDSLNNNGSFPPPAHRTTWQDALLHSSSSSSSSHAGERGMGSWSGAGLWGRGWCWGELLPGGPAAVPALVKAWWGFRRGVGGGGLTWGSAFPCRTLVSPRLHPRRTLPGEPEGAEPRRRWAGPRLAAALPL